MKLKHRNSQKRIYFKDAIYFVTTNTHNWLPYFREQIFCELFMENLKLCKQIKGFKLYAWFLGYDHFHLLLQPNDNFNYSKIMKSLKENISCDINQIIRSREGATSTSRLQMDCYEKFQWHKSFHDHVIHNNSDFEHHWGYIEYNPIKHNMPDIWEYVFTNPKYEDFINEIEL